MSEQIKNKILLKGDDRWQEPDEILENTKQSDLADKIATIKKDADGNREALRVITSQKLMKKYGKPEAGVSQKAQHSDDSSRLVVEGLTGDLKIPDGNEDGHNLNMKRLVAQAVDGHTYVQKEIVIHRPGEVVSTGPIITSIKEADLPSAYQLEEVLEIPSAVEGMDREEASRIINKLLNGIANKYKIENFLDSSRINFFSMEHGGATIGDKALEFTITEKQKEQVVEELVYFMEGHKNTLVENDILNTKFYNMVVLLNKFSSITNDTEDKLLLNTGFIDEVVKNVEDNHTSPLAFVNIQSIIKSQIEVLSDEQVKAILNIFLKRNDFNNDTIVLIKHYHANSWNKFSNTREFQEHQEFLRVMTEKLTHEVSVEEIIEKIEYYGNQLSGLILDEYKATSNIGLEFEFFKTGDQGEFSDNEGALKKYITQYPFDGSSINRDQEQTECRFKNGGVKYNDNLFVNLAQIGKNLESNQSFISCGSLHLNMDNVESEEKYWDEFFLFEKSDKGRFEMRHMVGPLLDSDYRHILNFSNVKKQFQIIDSIYEEYTTEDIHIFFKNNDRIKQKEFSDVYDELNKLQVEILLTVAKESGDSDLVSLILSGYQKNTLPMINVLAVLEEEIISINGTPGNILAIAEVAKINWQAGLRLAEKITSIDGAEGNILAIAEVAKINWQVGVVLVEKITAINEQVMLNMSRLQFVDFKTYLIALALISESIEGSSKNILAIVEAIKINWQAGLTLAEKITSIDGTEENILAIIEVSNIDEYIALELARKVDHIQNTLNITQIFNAAGMVSGELKSILEDIVKA